MEDYLQEGFGFATLGSICILIATLISDKLLISGIKETVGGFILAGFLLIFSVSLLLLSDLLNWKFGKEQLSLWFLWAGIFVLFLSSLFLLIGYVDYLFSIFFKK